MSSQSTANCFETTGGGNDAAPEVHVAYISMGSNMGERAANCARAVEILAATDGVRVIGRSRLFSTEPVDYTDQQWFVNGVVKVETTLSPPELLARLKEIERRAGRTASAVRFGPRVLDLDIVLFDDMVMEADGLVIPHPRMHRRRFVLGPFCDIDPEVVHPVLKQSMRQLYEGLDESGQGVMEYVR
ncbi:MAG: 2-amino-4-hydroxy-6-hydroxymethyldihydropteridine diphosphokinase [Thermodesulfobacteriota bacterium]